VNALFDIWYPVADEIGQRNGLLPIHILAYLKHSNPYYLDRSPKEQGTDLTEFVNKNKKLIFNVIEQIKSVLLRNAHKISRENDVCPQCGFSR
jgi:hypothetical protein